MSVQDFGQVPSSTHVVSAGLDLRVEPVLVLVPEGRVADQQDVEDDPAGPDVHGLAVGLLFQYFRRQIAGGTREACRGMEREKEDYLRGRNGLQRGIDNCH